MHYGLKYYLHIFFFFYASVFFQRGDASVALLEVVGGKGAVQVNGKLYQKSSSLILSGGDELVFSASGKHAYVSFFVVSNSAFARSVSCLLF